MSDKPEDDVQPDEPDTGNPESATDEGDLKSELERWKREKRKWEDRAKQNSDAAKRLAEIEDAKKSEIERSAEAQKAAEAKAQSAEQELSRLRVAMRKGLTEAQAKRLIGETEEEMEADADELLATFSPPKDDDDGETPDTNAQRRPRERLRPGATPPKEPAPSAKDIVDKVTAAKAL